MSEDALVCFRLGKRTYPDDVHRGKILRAFVRGEGYQYCCEECITLYDDIKEPEDYAE